MVLCVCYVNDVASTCHARANERGIYGYKVCETLHSDSNQKTGNIKESKLEMKARIDKILHINNSFWLYTIKFGYKILHINNFWFYTIIFGLKYYTLITISGSTP